MAVCSLNVCTKNTSAVAPVEGHLILRSILSERCRCHLAPTTRVHVVILVLVRCVETATEAPERLSISLGGCATVVQNTSRFEGYGTGEDHGEFECGTTVAQTLVSHIVGTET